MKIAVVGAGVSGLSAAYILSQKYEVELFESEPRLGGHAHTVFTENSQMPIDTGFLVFNHLTYPELTKMLKYLDVETVDSDMSLSIQTSNNIEWAGTNLKSIFAQKKNLANPFFIKMLYDIIKFNKQAEENLSLAKKNKWTIHDLIQFRNLSKSFCNWYLLPMTGAIWSMSYKNCLDFPAETFLQFCINHHLLQIDNRPVWKTILNGSVNYVNKLKLGIKKIHTNTEIKNISTNKEQLILSSQNSNFIFDKIIFATSVPITYKILKNNFTALATYFEKATTSENQVYLHKDIKVMPKNKICWSSWNVNAKNKSDDFSPIELTYYSNKLQPLNTQDDYFITLNPTEKLQNCHSSYTYYHPQFNQNLLDLQKKLPSLQGTSGIYFAGAWTRYGFHEDGLLSAINVAQQFGVLPQWNK